MNRNEHSPRETATQIHTSRSALIVEREFADISDQEIRDAVTETMKACFATLIANRNGKIRSATVQDLFGDLSVMKEYVRLKKNQAYLRILFDKRTRKMIRALLNGHGENTSQKGWFESNAAGAQHNTTPARSEDYR